MRLNALSYYADFFLGGAVILALLLGGLLPAIAAGRVVELAVWAVAAPAGIVVWSLLEYAVHRYLYHEVPFFRQLHGRHHAEPGAFIGGPPVIAVAVLFCLAYLPLAPFSQAAAGGFGTGLLAGYMAYMLVHHADHYWKAAPGTLLYTLRRHHALHHHRHEDGNFGIITPFWDRVFGTALEPGRDRPGRRPA